MPTPVLATKLYVPPVRSRIVPRARLIDRMNQGLHGKLTLISAPAGFGKTTLVSAWVADCGRPIAWLSLDEKDSDSTRFMTYLIAALQTIAPQIGEAMLALLQSPQPPPTESLMTALINALVTLPEDFLFDLDDYHVVDARPVDNALAFLLEHSPPQMHLVITTREDPSLPLARLRARGQMTELRAADLRFTPDEAASFLNQVMNLDLSADDVAALDARTEGWIAGLQLAALSMQGRRDAAFFTESFSGGHHFVLDYLVEEVLHQQPANIQIFLLHTSILDRLCGPLCDAVMFDPSVSGQDMLEHLERVNLFLIPLDNERHWYRYHHLFADLLRQRLHQNMGPENGSDLHRRASQWYEDQGLELEAFYHAAAAHDIDRAAHLIDGKGVPLHFRGALTPVLNWLESLPITALNARPALWVTYASALTLAGQLSQRIEDKLQAAETILKDIEPDAQNRDLVGQIAAIRAMLAIPTNDVDTIIAQSRRALQDLHPDNLPIRMTATWTLGYAYQNVGDRAAAVQAYAATLSISQPSGNIMNTLAAATCLGQVRESQNQLHLAEEQYRYVLQLMGDPPLPYACEAYLGLARLCYQRNDLQAAHQYGEQSVQLALQIENVDTPAAGWLLLAHVKRALGDISGSAAMLAEAEAFIGQRNFTHLLPQLAEEQIRALLYQGNLTAAAHLAEEHQLPLSRARIYLAQGEPSAALALLEPLRQQAEAKNWADEQLKVIALQAVGHYANGDIDTAAQTLEDALALAVPDGLIRIFVDEGPPMMELLSAALARGVLPDYAHKVLTAFHTDTTLSQPSASQPLLEPLSKRELEVLRLVAQGLSNREISQRLFLALDTVKGHNRRIYAKLDVQRRTEAVARARELGLF